MRRPDDWQGLGRIWRCKSAPIASACMTCERRRLQIVADITAKRRYFAFPQRIPPPTTSLLTWFCSCDYLENILIMECEVKSSKMGSTVDSHMAAEESAEGRAAEAAATMPGQLCVWCFAFGARCRRCSLCRVPWYCSVECQAAHWRVSHRRECWGLIFLRECQVLPNHLRLQVLEFAVGRQFPRAS